MANRCLLHVNKLDEFKEFLDSEGIAHRNGKGDFQVMQIYTDNGWRCIYSRISMPEHFTVQKGLEGYVKKFISKGKE